MTIIGDSVATVWGELLVKLHYYGEFSSPRSQPTKELLGVQLKINDLRNNVLICDKRNLNYRFMVAEWLWIALGRQDVAGISRWNGEIKKFSDDGVKFEGAYGPRLQGQWPWLIKKLEQDDCTRQGVVSIWTPSPPSSRDVPCTLSLQFLYRDGRLNCIVSMRSSDVWLGLPYDVFNFSMLVNGIAGELGVEPGWLQMNLGSSHWYQEHWIEPSFSAQFLRSPRLDMMPPRWLDECFNGEKSAVKPEGFWPWYYKVLTQTNRTDALEVLRDLATYA